MKLPIKNTDSCFIYLIYQNVTKCMQVKTFSGNMAFHRPMIWTQVHCQKQTTQNKKDKNERKQPQSWTPFDKC